MILEGVRRDRTGRYEFDKQIDLDTDILDLHNNTHGHDLIGNIDLVYGYTFNKNASKLSIKKNLGIVLNMNCVILKFLHQRTF